MGQVTNTIMMIRPANFGFNQETAQNNSFQSEPNDDNIEGIAAKAIEEFDNAVNVLKTNGVHVVVIQDSEEPIKPDAIFPNNWFSTHDPDVLITYPMWAENRRIERRQEIIDQLSDKFKINRRYNFEYLEENNQFLEGTGSMILDRENKIVYACLSPRTEALVLEKFCVLMGYQKVIFTSLDDQGDEIYHTNVMMAVADQYVVICLESIADEEERKMVSNTIKNSGKEIFDITIRQVNHFAGNMLQVRNDRGDLFMVMSEDAAKSLTMTQREQLRQWNELIVLPIPTIEKFGGGSIRCMMAEIFLERKEN